MLKIKVRSRGAKITSLKYKNTELLYLPPTPQPDPQPKDVFDERFAWGADICLPGILKEPGINDHGNFWTAEFKLSGKNYTRSVRGLELKVNFSLTKNSLIRTYTLTNLTNKPQPFIFADHFLMPIAPKHKQPWCKKSFILKNTFTYSHPSGLKLTFSSQQLPFIGLWQTEGGWNNQFNLGLELTNATTDSLSEAVKLGQAWQLNPHQTKTWQIQLALHSQ